MKSVLHAAVYLELLLCDPGQGAPLQAALQQVVGVLPEARVHPPQPVRQVAGVAGRVVGVGLQLSELPEEPAGQASGILVFETQFSGGVLLWGKQESPQFFQCHRSAQISTLISTKNTAFTQCSFTAVQVELFFFAYTEVDSSLQCDNNMKYPGKV